MFLKNNQSYEYQGIREVKQYSEFVKYKHNFKAKHLENNIPPRLEGVGLIIYSLNQVAKDFPRVLDITIE